MRIGFCLPQFGGLAREAGRVTWFAAEAERLGAYSLWVGDRLIAPVEPAVGYGGTDTIPAEFRSLLDPFVVLTLAAAATREALLGSSVLNMPWYPPAMLARSLTTIDVASGGRLIAGFGSGWSPEEFQAAGIPWRGRGARLEESLDALEAIWAASPASYQGAAWTVPASHIDLKPAQQPRPPIYLGGGSEAALRRIGRRADGWLPSVRLPAVRPEFILRQRDVIQRAAGEAGRDVSGLPTALRVNVPAGTPVTRITEAIGDLAGATGIGHFFVDLMYLAGTADEALGLAAKILAQA